MTRQRRMMQRRLKGSASCFSLLVLLVNSLDIAFVGAFSARLSRPWEPSLELVLTTETHRFFRSSKELTSRAKVTASTSAATTQLAATSDDRNTDSSSDDGEAESTPESASLSPSQLFLASTSEDQASEPVDLTPRINGAAHALAPTVWDCLGPLFQLTRPANFPGVVLLHLLGGYLSLAYTEQGHLFTRILFQAPSMHIVLVALLLTSSTSMVVNDYYDKKLGRDTDKKSPLISGEVTFAIVRNFLNYLYGAALICVAFVPGIPARISVIIGLMLTFFYTKHIKPLTWIKNVMCASLIALSPATSGFAALKVASEISNGPWGNLRVLATPSLWRLVAMLFFGVCGREIMMDITDLNDDRLNRVRTIPVAYGRKYASAVAMICYVVSGAWVVGGPLSQLLAQIGQSFSLAAVKSVLWANPGGLTRRLAFASFGFGMLVRRALQVFSTKGEDGALIENAVGEGQLAMIICLGSFI